MAFQFLRYTVIALAPYLANGVREGTPFVASPRTLAVSEAIYRTSRGRDVIGKAWPGGQVTRVKNVAAYFHTPDETHQTLQPFRR